MRAVQVAEWACKPGLAAPAVTLSFAVAPVRMAIAARLHSALANPRAQALLEILCSLVDPVLLVLVTYASLLVAEGMKQVVLLWWQAAPVTQELAVLLPCRAVVAPVCLVVRSQSHPLMVAPAAAVVTFPLLLGRLRLARAGLSRYVLVTHL